MCMCYIVYTIQYKRVIPHKETYLPDVERIVRPKLGHCYPIDFSFELIRYLDGNFACSKGLFDELYWLST